MSDLPFASVPALAGRLAGSMDVEGKIPRALEDLGPISGRAVAVLDVPGTPWVERLRGVAGDLLVAPAGGPGDPLRLPAGDASLDAVVTLWTGFRGVDRADLVEADRALRPGGRLLVVHDYGRDDVSTLRGAGAPEYGAWSRRDGPFLREAGFRIRVIHCFWTFASMDDAHEALALFGEAGGAVTARLKRPRLSWNVAVYHRDRGEPLPAAAADA